MDGLEKARARINEADRKMAELFCERMSAAAEIAKYKKEHALPITDKAREEDLIRKNTEYIDDAVIREYYLEFIKTAIQLSKSYQKRILDINDKDRT